MAEAKRAYHSELRAKQAAQTRQAVLAAAGTCFSSRGYAGTSLTDIAHEAGVSVETVKAIAPKRDLLLMAFRQSFTGSPGGELIAEKEAGARLLAIDDGEEFLSALVDFLAAANAASSRLWRAFTSAANSDPALASALREHMGRRRADCEHAIDAFAARGMLHGSVSRDERVETYIYLVAPETHEHFVLDVGWAQPSYRDWLEQAVRSMVLRSV
ncbi:TetR/AcrR family transcriptional regulator [Jiangella endophytica]|uniref:TetR/AcrR family transcriptional regulator n=1 Tax=Jiangella endophytica TaxID=1623398 RepID=UPI001300B77D|nr:TetR/AcrR family transcriptional regulator [Jiangella endophytica]